ncbi:MAG: type IX secretion system membrane protein PorP/SprF [Chloroflexia bacterium]|nr:type IX secretion system membrane protein PorP/SprF [Chloroflexia bacterium]
MMKRLILIQALLLSLICVNAQQDPLLSHAFFNKVHKNPAFAGLQGEICANIINRQQWVGLEGAPQTTVLTINSPLNLFGINSGVGISILDDRLGFETNFSGSIDYSYIHSLSVGTLSLGVKLGIFNKAFDGTWELPDGSNGGTDPIVPSEKDQGLSFDMSFGAVYTLDNFYVGISSMHLTQSKFNLQSGKELPYLKRHYYLMTGYKLDLSSKPIEIYPNLLVKYDGASPQFTINFNTVYNKKFWGGVTYRTTDALDINIGLELFNGIKIGYAYGLNLSKLINTNSGSHEIMLGYCFDFEINRAPQKYRSVRFL